MKKKEIIKGFKGFEKDLTCRGFQYEIGKTYEIKENIKLCEKGFHFCRKLWDVNDFYNFGNEDYRYCEVEALGEVINDNKKSVTNKIKIVREIPKEEFIESVNMGKNNSGYCNTGYWNTGDCNTGNRNTGNRNTGNRNTGYLNTGDCNTGYWNTGNRNTGNRNTGNRNTGNRNTGDCNTGDCNTGDWNKTDRSSGVFCNQQHKLIMFNKETDMSYEEWTKTRAYDVLQMIEKSKWICFDNMTDEEKEKYPSAKNCDGYLKEIPRKEAVKDWWERLDNYDKQEIFNLPNFDLDVFNDIMESEISEEEYKEIMRSLVNI